MVMEGDLTWGGEHRVKYTDDILQKYTPATYMTLLTNVIQINFIKIKKIILKKKIMTSSLSSRLLPTFLPHGYLHIESSTPSKCSPHSSIPLKHKTSTCNVAESNTEVIPNSSFFTYTTSSPSPSCVESTSKIYPNSVHHLCLHQHQC